jgi:hypothetical protein
VFSLRSRLRGGARWIRTVGTSSKRASKARCVSDLLGFNPRARCDGEAQWASLNDPVVRFLRPVEGRRPGDHGTKPPPGRTLRLSNGLAVGLPANRTVRGAKKSLTVRHRRSRDSSEFLAWLHSELLRAGCAPWVMNPYASFHRCRIQDKG